MSPFPNWTQSELIAEAIAVLSHPAGYSDPIETAKRWLETPPTAQKVYVVVGPLSEDEPAVFASQDLADRFAEAESSVLGSAGVFPSIVCEDELAEKMIREAQGDDDDTGAEDQHVAAEGLSSKKRETLWLQLCKHYGANPADTCIGGLVYSDRVERFCGVATEFHGEHENGSALGTFPTFEEACDALGSFVLDGYAPEAVYDLDTGERIDVHVASPVITRSEDQMGANPLLPEELSRMSPNNVPHGVAWPILTDGCSPPPGWSWVEKDDDAGVYQYDDDAADALVAAGIATEWAHFNRETHELILIDEVVSYTGPMGIAVNVPDPTTDEVDERDPSDELEA